MNLNGIFSKSPLKSVIFYRNCELARHWLSWLHHPCGTQQRGIYTFVNLKVSKLFVDMFDQQNQALKELRSTFHVKKKITQCRHISWQNPLTGRRLFGSSLGWKATVASSATAAWSSSKMADTKRCSSAMEKRTFWVWQITSLKRK